MNYCVELLHFGAECEPGIIISDVLRLKRKTLFMAGRYSFNSILDYLNDANYENIYDRLCLTPGHDVDASKTIMRHQLYNFQFPHDYMFENGEITNYDAIVKRFDEKIANFRNVLRNERMVIFLGYTCDVRSLRIKEMLGWMQKNMIRFHLVLFSYNDDKAQPLCNVESKNLSIIRMGERVWYWSTTQEKKEEIKRDHYRRFIQSLDEKNIVHDFPHPDEIFNG